MTVCDEVSFQVLDRVDETLFVVLKRASLRGLLEPIALWLQGKDMLESCASIIYGLKFVSN